MQDAVAMREKLFTMRISETELARFQRIADHNKTTIAGLFRFLVDREDERILNEEVERKRLAARKWESDKAFLSWLVGLSNLRKLRVMFDDRRTSLGLTDGRDHHLNLTLEGAIQLLENWKDSAVIEVDRHTGVAKVRRGSRTSEERPPLEVMW